MFRSTLRLTAAPALAAFVALAPCTASAQGFLNDLFGGSDRFGPPAASPQDRPQDRPQQPPQQQPAQWQQQPYGGQAPQGPGEEMSMRIGRLEAQIRQLTGAIEQLQYRNQQLEAQLQRMQGGAAAPPARTPAQPQMQPQIQPQVQPPPAAPPPGRRGEGVFDPAQNPNAPGAPRVLGTLPSNSSGGGAPSYPGALPGTTQPGTPQPGTMAQSSPSYEDEEVGAPGGRAAGAPLDLSTLAGAAVNDRGLDRGLGQPGATEALPPPRTQGGYGGQAAQGGQGGGAPGGGAQGGGAQVATLPPTDSPRDTYDMAYGYVMRKDYALAENGFRVFLSRFPSDRLVPDAQYWLGETMFQRQRYRDAAEQFLAVSTKFETNARAPDALLRLGQSLAAMGEREAACASLAEVGRKYPRASVAVRQGVEREQKRVRC
jgi:tol-pal system protein YbgF